MLLDYENIDVADAFGIGGVLRFNGRDSGYYIAAIDDKGYNTHYYGDKSDENSHKSYYLALDIRNGVKENGTVKYETVAFKVNFTEGSYGIVTLKSSHLSDSKKQEDMFPHAMPVRLCKSIL
jgi:hypothetical protein